MYDLTIGDYQYAKPLYYLLFNLIVECDCYTRNVYNVYSVHV